MTKTTPNLGWTDMTTTATKPTPEQAKQIGEIISRKWDEIGYDVLYAVAQGKGKDVERITMARRDVIEICMDQAYGEITGELRAAFDALSYDGKVRLARPFFPFARYGV